MIREEEGLFHDCQRVTAQVESLATYRLNNFGEKHLPSLL
jgi:hypothetical protein